MAISPTYASPGCMAKTVDDLTELVRVMLEASNAKEKTSIPDEKELNKGWEGLKLGFVNHDFEPIPTSWTGMTEIEILELVSSICYCISLKLELRVWSQKSKYEEAISKMGQLGAEVHYPISLPALETDPQFLHEGNPAINALVCG